MQDGLNYELVDNSNVNGGVIVVKVNLAIHHPPLY